MRDAISLLDQLLSYDEALLDLARVERVLGLVNAGAIGQLVDHMTEGDGAAGLSLLGEMVADGVELGQLVDQIIAYLRGVLFARITESADALDAAEDTRAAMLRQARLMDHAELLAAIGAFLEARADLRDQVPGVPQLPVELAYLRALPRQAAPCAARPGPTAGITPPAPPRDTPIEKRAEPPREEVKRVAPAASAPAAPVSSPGSGKAASVPSGDLLEDARESWDEFLGQAGKSCGMKVQAALRSVRTLDANGQTLVLHFSHAFSRDMVNQPEYRPKLEALWQKMLGQSVYIRCVLQGETPDLPASPRQETAAEGNDEDPLLRDALNLGAVVKPLQTKG